MVTPGIDGGGVNLKFLLLQLAAVAALTGVFWNTIASPLEKTDKNDVVAPLRVRITRLREKGKQPSVYRTEGCF